MNDNAYSNLLKELKSGKKVIMITNLQTSEKKIFTQEHLCSDKNKTIYNPLIEKAKVALKTGFPETYNASKGLWLIEPFFPEPRIIVFGGGHIATPLVEFGSKSGFSITVIDDRPAFANTKRFPLAHTVICESFDKSFNLIDINEGSYIVIVTRGHRHDLECLKKVLKYNTAYIGMIGSKLRVKTVKDLLLAEGFSKDSLDNINAPIGLEIGGITPEEIAISIIAQIIKYRRIINPIKNSSTKINSPEFDPEVISNLSNNEVKKAIVTIINSKGSVPRGAGAKMVVYPKGEIIGSIGGGCSEGIVIDSARYLLRNGGYEIKKIDMSLTAEDDGMVCGGIMDVLIEVY